MRLGLLLETRGDLTAAESLLLHAAEVDHQFGPRAALMRYYARRRDDKPFWKWARLAIERSFGDVGPLFDLCWTMASEPDDVYRLAVPRTRPLIRSYLWYLLAHERTSAAVEPARDLLAGAGSADRDVLLGYCNRLLPSSPREAAEVWNGLVRRNLLPQSEIHPEQRPVIIDASFQSGTGNGGFDWILGAAPGVSTARLPGGGIEFSFSGRQPEAVDLVWQTLLLTPGRKYRISAGFQTENVASPGGFEMVLEGRGEGAPLERSALPPSETPANAAVVFTAPPSGVATIRARYRRPLGSVRTEGTLVVKEFRIAEAE